MFLCVLTIILAKVSSTYVTKSVLMDDSSQLRHSQVTLSMRKLCHQLYHTLFQILVTGLGSGTGLGCDYQHFDK